MPEFLYSRVFVALRWPFYAIIQVFSLLLHGAFAISAPPSSLSRFGVSFIRFVGAHSKVVFVSQLLHLVHLELLDVFFFLFHAPRRDLWFVNVIKAYLPRDLKSPYYFPTFG